LVIGVVALLVFGPKGLAEVARTLGKSLRAFQPTIKELQQVSREFKATLEQEIGLDELRNPSNDYPPTTSQPRPNSVSSSTPTSMPSTLSATEAPPAAPQTEDGASQPKPYTTEDYFRITEDQANALVTEEQRKASEAAAWGGSPPVKPAVEAPSAETPAESFFSGTSQVGSTPTEPIENSTGNGSSKL
jgi:TatA/E family protein of Tat protein translocase